MNAKKKEIYLPILGLVFICLLGAPFFIEWVGMKRLHLDAVRLGDPEMVSLPSQSEGEQYQVVYQIENNATKEVTAFIRCEIGSLVQGGTISRTGAQLVKFQPIASKTSQIQILPKQSLEIKETLQIYPESYAYLVMPLSQLKPKVLVEKVEFTQAD